MEIGSDSIVRVSRAAAEKRIQYCPVKPWLKANLGNHGLMDSTVYREIHKRHILTHIE
jgi:hypothetical protein